MSKSIDEITAEVNSLVSQINQDLQISSPSKLFDSSPLQKAATALSGLVFIRGPFSGFVSAALEGERLVTEIAIIANVTIDEVKDFFQSHHYSLEFIKRAIQAGARLDEEDIKRTMEEQEIRHSIGWSCSPTPIEIALTKLEEQYTFVVTLPNNDRRQVKAAYMEVDGATLYFEDEDHETILAFGPGHWVWAERVEDTS